MHIALLYPPPWEIPPPGQAPDPAGQAPPLGLDLKKCLSGDVQNIPYGLLSIAAQALRAGHQVTVLNLFMFSWPDITRILKQLPADIYGLSCFTSNRRGTLSVAQLLRRTHPSAHITVGGPHASALAPEMLAHCEALDSVVIGEGEETFRELTHRVSRGTPLEGLAGCVWRKNGRIESGPPRPRLKDLDDLAAPCTVIRGLEARAGAPPQSDLLGLDGIGLLWAAANRGGRLLVRLRGLRWRLRVREVCFESAGVCLEGLGVGLEVLQERLQRR